MFRSKLILTGLIGLGLTLGLIQVPRAAAAFTADIKAESVTKLPSTPIGDKEELADLLVKISAICAKVTEAGYTVAHVEVDRLVKGKIYASSRTLFPGNTYRVVGIGGKGIADLDMKIEDGEGNTVGKDTEADNVPIVDANPKTESSYTIKVAASAMEKGADPELPYYFCWVIAFKNK